MINLNTAHQALTRLFTSKREDWNEEDRELAFKFVIEKGKVFRSDMVVGDPYLTAFNQGRRAFALDLLKFLAKDPTKVELDIHKTLERKIEDE